MIVFYGRGSGQGHMMRSLAMARLMKDLDPVVIHDSPWRVPCEVEGVRQIPGNYAIQFLMQNKPDVLVVDAQPDGHAGELRNFLPILAMPKVFTYRHVEQKPQDLSQYALVLMAEPDEGVSGLDVCPILIRDPEDFEQGDGETYERPEEPSTYPMMAEMAKARDVAGPAGYNMFWEAMALNKQGVWSVAPRQEEEQTWRINTFVEKRGPMTNKASVAVNAIRQLLQSED